MKLTTLCYPVVDGCVLLAMKKRGFGIGKWNGPGGKYKDGETAEGACRRETREEVGVEIVTLSERGVIEFVFEQKPEWNNRCTIFVATEIAGEPTESDEMRPQWFALDDVPLQDMWEDDAIWLMDVLQGGTVNKRFYFSESGSLLRQEDLPSDAQVA